MSEAELDCPACKRAIEASRFFDTVTHWVPSLDVATWKCPECADVSEIQLESGAVWFGYLSGAGTAHFSGMQKIVVSGLIVQRVPDGLAIELDDRRWLLSETL